MSTAIDPVTLAVLQGRLEQIADEMDATLFRSAFVAPLMISASSVGVLWQWFYNPAFGLINYYALMIGLPDVEWGEVVTAFVVTKPGASVAEGDLVEHCRTRLAGYKKPRAVRFVASLPRSHYGKVLRAQLIAEAAG